ncbi:hypothetical protein QAD02_016386 [Eretmocerus hayati]|uniref:Uncharacterized protein n=1 Tax=Eretmocerus hayati TaxID=131215 RepID=A0ACC2PDD1_9HYME|nr:hypothetical protein QAD02_016386 [Eretmocerus hayati]
MSIDALNGKIGLFYLVFYAVLAALVAICFWGFLIGLDKRIPRWQLKESIIGDSPGMGFRPSPPPDNVDSTLIWFKAQTPHYDHWVNSLEEFLNVYRAPGRTPGRGQNTNTCDWEKGPDPGKVCTINVKVWNQCTYENKYGYYKSTPCVFIKLNKIYGWVPEFYNDTATLPDEMPENLRKYITGITDPLKRNSIWVSCEGENPADKENVGPIQLYPEYGFPGYYFPFKNLEGYLSPLVAVYFERPRAGVLINVECKAWAKNINHHRNGTLGSVHFELLID